MNTDTLFLAWQDRAKTRLWFTIGRLDANIERKWYRFRYTAGAKRAKKEVGLLPLLDFPDFNQDYQASRLFALFRNRVINPSRPDRFDYLDGLDLSRNANPLEVLSVNGGERMTDAYEVFPKLVKDASGRFKCRFLLHGWRHLSEYSQERVWDLKPDEKLQVAMELNNPVTGLALQLQTQDYCMIGWTPRYLVGDLAKAIVESENEYEATVVKTNRMPPPSNQRVLIEFRGKWEKHKPMIDDDFKTLGQGIKAAGNIR